MLYVRSIELTHFIIGSLYLLTSISPFHLPSAPGNHHSTFFLSLAFLDSTGK